MDKSTEKILTLISKLSDALKKNLQKGFHGEVKLTVIIHDGGIQEIKVNEQENIR